MRVLSEKFHSHQSQICAMRESRFLFVGFSLLSSFPMPWQETRSGNLFFIEKKTYTVARLGNKEERMYDIEKICDNQVIPPYCLSGHCMAHS